MKFLKIIRHNSGIQYYVIRVNSYYVIQKKGQYIEI